jgi:hypothetical protein
MGRFFLGIVIVSVALILALYFHIVTLQDLANVGLLQSGCLLACAGHPCSTLASKFLVPRPRRMVFTYPAEAKTDRTVRIYHSIRAFFWRSRMRTSASCFEVTISDSSGTRASLLSCLSWSSCSCVGFSMAFSQVKTSLGTARSLGQSLKGAGPEQAFRCDVAILYIGEEGWLDPGRF